MYINDLTNKILESSYYNKTNIIINDKIYIITHFVRGFYDTIFYLDDFNSGWNYIQLDIDDDLCSTNMINMKWMKIVI